MDSIDVSAIERIYNEQMVGYHSQQCTAGCIRACLQLFLKQRFDDRFVHHRRCYASHASHMYVSLTVVCSISVSEFALLWRKTKYIKETLHRVATAPAVSSAIVRDDNVCVAVLLLLFSSPLHKWFYLSWYYIFIENSLLKYPSVKVGTLLSCVKNHNGIILPYQVT